MLTLSLQGQDSLTRAASMPAVSTTISKATSTNVSEVHPEVSTSDSLSSPSTLNASLSYKISRTPSAQLPIYQLSKSGGNKQLTRLRKLSGNLDALKQDIRQALGLDEYILDPRGRKKEMVTVNRLTQHVIVRGWRKAELVKWAEGCGF